MNQIAAVVPLRTLADGKSRLRSVLPPRWRQALILALLERVLQALADTGSFTTILVVSPDPLLLRLAIAMQSGITPLQQTNEGLNRGIWQATGWLQATGIQTMAVFHADLPLITPLAVQQCMEAIGEAQVVIVPDRHRHGTTALVVRPPGAIPWRFGEASFGRHADEATHHGLVWQAILSPELSSDCDTAADLRYLLRHHPLTSLAMLRRMLHYATHLPQIRQCTTPVINTHAPEAC